MHTAGHTLGHARCKGKSQTPICTPTCIYKCANPPVRNASSTHAAQYTSPTRAHISVHIGTLLCTHTRSPRVCLHMPVTLTVLGQDPQGMHEHILVNKQGYTQTLLHRRARTRVCTPRARARTEPPARTASRKALASSPIPLHRRAGGGGMGVGGEDRAGRGSRGPPPPQACDRLILLSHLRPANFVPYPNQTISQMKVM